tara:strand:+ start:394 stop:588 length:195 start_codon:yes stop_codon:yes gene_type:complete
MKIRKKIKSIKYALFYPEGKDIKFDEECNKSFLNFLDKVYNFLLTGMIIVGIFSAYFFIRYGTI